MKPNLQVSSLRWVVCGLLLLITTVNYMDRSALGLVEPILRHLFAGDNNPAHFNRDYSRIVNCFIFAYGIGLLLAGRVIDRIGARMGLALSIAVWAAASISHTLATTVLGFGIARFALGLGEAGNFPAALKATADWFPAEERALATGIFNSGTSAASLIAPLLIPWVAVRFGWKAAFLTTGGLSLCLLAAWLVFPYNRLQQRFSANSTLSVDAEKKERASFITLLRSRGTWSFALSKAFTDPVWWFYLFWLPKFFNERFSINMSELGLPLIVIYCGATIGSVGGGWIAGLAMRRGRTLRQGRRFAMLICAIGSTVVLLVPFIHQLWQAIAVLSVATAAHQGWSSNLLSTPSDRFPSTSVGTVVGIGGAIGSIGSTVFTYLVGVLWAHHSMLIFFAAGLAYLLSLFFFQGGRFAPIPSPESHSEAS
ncbi:MAG TPA: MFS transporter [Terracidiphilus sp.]|nr:MFS transporter [Terracidiphilus sp.]